MSEEADVTLYKKGGKLRDRIDRRPVVGDVVYLSPKTLKPVKRVTKNQKVLFGYKKDGKINVLHPEPQSPDGRLKAWLKKHISTNGDKAFALYEQRGRELALDKKGKVRKYKSGRNMRVTKLAIPSTQRQQRAVLYKKGKRARPIDHAFHRHSKEQLLSRLVLTPIKPTGQVFELNLSGETIVDSLRNLVVDKSIRNLKKYQRIFYEWVLIYRDPTTGEKITVPGYGREDIPPGLRKVHARAGDALHPYFFRDKLTRINSLAVGLGYNIRTTLAHQGLRFTSAKKLDNIQQQYLNLADKAEKAGDDDRLKKLSKIIERIERPWFRGPTLSQLQPIFKERDDGSREHTKDEHDRVRIRIRFTIEEDESLKRQLKKKNKRKKKGRKK